MGMNICRFISRKLANRNWDSKNAYLRKQGAKIGRNTRLNCTVDSFGTEPYLIEVGDNCLFAGNIHLITHDGGVVVLNNMDYFDGKKMDKISSIKIGNNVYIGFGAYVMPGVTIGDNVIIGAGAVVTKDIPSYSVAVGVPAKVVGDIDTYYNNALKKDILYETLGMSQKNKRKYFETIKN